MSSTFRPLPRFALGWVPGCPTSHRTFQSIRSFPNVSLEQFPGTSSGLMTYPSGILWGVFSGTAFPCSSLPVQDTSDLLSAQEMSCSMVLFPIDPPLCQFRKLLRDKQVWWVFSQQLGRNCGPCFRAACLAVSMHHFCPGHAATIILATLEWPASTNIIISSIADVISTSDFRDVDLWERSGQGPSHEVGLSCLLWRTS